MPGGKCKFNANWRTNSCYSDWLDAVQCNVFMARCRLCLKNVDIGNMGEHALKSHAKSAKHQKACQEKQSNANLSSLIRPSVPESSDTKSPVMHSHSVIQTMNGNNTVHGRQPTLGLTSRDVLKAELIWSVKVVSGHLSWNSCAHMGETFRHMFPDSDIAKQFSCGENKAMYLSVFGLGVYLEHMLHDKVKADNVKNIVLLFDESHNKSLEKKQLDIYVRYWDTITNTVMTDYLDSNFLGHGRADDILPYLISKLEKLDAHGKIIQLSMDGPNVNWKIWERLLSTLQEKNCSLINVGSCGLHTIHNSFKNGFSNDSTPKILKALYWLFKESPARREDYIKITGSDKFPLKFCGLRWLENRAVASRAFEIWPNIVKFVKTVQKSKDYTTPTCQSFLTLLDSVGDKTAPAKIAFFEHINNIVFPFLEMFQSDLPLMPFMCSHLEKIMRRLLTKVIKPDIIREASTTTKLLQIEIEKNLLSYKKVDISRFGCPLMIHSDQGRNYESHIFQELCQLLEIKKS